MPLDEIKSIGVCGSGGNIQSAELEHGDQHGKFRLVHRFALRFPTYLVKNGREIIPLEIHSVPDRGRGENGNALQGPQVEWFGVRARRPCSIRVVSPILAVNRIWRRRVSWIGVSGNCKHEHRNKGL